MLPISVKYLCRNSKNRADFSHYLKRFMMDSWLLPSSQIVGTMYNTVVSIKCMMWKVCRSPTLYSYLKQLLNANGINRVRWVVLGLSQDGACNYLIENLSEKSLNGDATLSSHLFSHWLIPLMSLNLNKVMLRDKKSVSTTVSKKNY